MARQLNVIGLISGGKDSFFSLLHCIANGHTITALANLSPPSHALGNDDLNSFMYQTVGHTLIPLYSLLLPVPLYRQEISGTAINQAREYYATLETQLPREGTTHATNANEETESMMALLHQIKSHHPEANAVCSGAILSSYQRTRIESVALRMQLTPLAYLWQYSVLPSPAPKPDGLLEDMAAVGLDARIVKVASGGLDEDLLLENVCAETTRRKLTKAMRRFGGSVLGEGGEFETFVVDGPEFFSKGALDIKKQDGKTIQGGGGEAWMTFAGSVIKWKVGEQGKERAWLRKLRIPDLLDMAFKRLLDALDSEARSNNLPPTSLPVTLPVSGGYERLDRSNMTGGKHTVRIVNMCAPFEGDGVEKQMNMIGHKLTDILCQELQQSLHDVVFATILLRSMDDFHTVNRVYSAVFSSGPNPPARVTVACADGLPDGANVMISFIVSQRSRTLREHLHVQSMSYWTPANIGPYSQAISIPLGVDETSKIVYVAGQIPLIPATMKIVHRELPAEGPGPSTKNAGFRLQTTLALQHLWRIGKAMSVGWWIGAIAFLVGGQDDLRQKARTTALAWKKIHEQEDDAGSPSETDTDAPGFDVWEQQHNKSWGPVARDENRTLPDFSQVSVVGTNESRLDRAGSAIPPFFAVEVAQLPRDSEIEWQGLGLSQSSVKIFETVSEDGITITVCSVGSNETVFGFIGLSMIPAIEVDLAARIQHALAILHKRCEMFGSFEVEGHQTIYTTHKIDASDDLNAQLVPCKSVWNIDGESLDAGMIVEIEL
ncbi:MAG: hypothetical protein LQ350_005174 [Teloschistes chrysophthalmus]|nr:MAG: hypothetical protein LQ350_005174 [Niorma chrysophthalma]